MARHRFRNQTVNQRLRMLAELGHLEVWSAYPDSFAAEVAGGIRITGFPLSRRLRQSVIKLPLFTCEVAAWSIFARLIRRRYRLVYSFQDSSAIAGLILRGRATRWVIDVLDDPALELRNALQQRRKGKVLLLSLRDKFFAALIPRADLVPTIGSSRNDVLPTLLQQKYKVHPGRVEPVTQAIDIRSLSVLSSDDGSREDPTIFYVGWVSPLRGVDTLIEAVRLLAEQGVALHLRLAGYVKRPDVAWLDGLARSLPGLFTYLGELPSSKTLDEIAKASICTCPFPDRPELAPVQPVKMIEYLALGKPVVASRLPGISSLIEDGKSGVLFEPGSPKDLATAMNRILTTPDLARSLSAEARQRAARFDIETATTPLARTLERWLA